ncbi:MAG: Peptidase family M50 [Methanocella sp. PtaU1.Bin125]|nr:MAG: Peptidase family M50 [Methanocella sp. PtaU1.Bin125]
MSFRYVPVVLVVLFTLVSTICPAYAHGIPQLAYIIDTDEMLACFGLAGDCNATIINAAPNISLNHAIVVLGSRADTTELGAFERYTAVHPVYEKLIIDDKTDAIFGVSTGEFDLILIGGPEHNAYTKKLLDQGVLKLDNVNMSQTGVVIEEAKTSSDHVVVVIGSANGYSNYTPVTIAPVIISPPVPPIAPVAAMVTGAGIGAVGSFAAFWSRTFEFMYGFISTFAGEVACEKETEIRKIHARRLKKIVFLGYSWREIIVAASCLLLFSIAFVIADRMSLLPGNILFYLVVGGFVVVAHDLGHRLVAYWLKVDAEFRFWGLGSATMLLTSWLFGLVFAQPSRVIIEKEDHTSEHMAAVMLAGPTISLGLSIIFLIMMLCDGPAGTIGLLGFSMNMVTVVYSMMPFDPMDGKTIFEWNRLYWAILFIPITSLFIIATYIVV